MDKEMGQRLKRISVPNVIHKVSRKKKGHVQSLNKKLIYFNTFYAQHMSQPLLFSHVFKLREMITDHDWLLFACIDVDCRKH